MSGVQGGCGKTTLAVHLAWAASERGWAVLVVDTAWDAEAYRRLGGDVDTRTPHAWAPRCLTVSAPGDGALDADQDLSPYDLVVVDTPTGGAPPSVSADLVLVAVDSPEGESYYTGGSSLDRSWAAAPVSFVANRCSGAHGNTGIPHAAAIFRSELRPAWADSRAGRGAVAIRAWADGVLDRLANTR